MVALTQLGLCGLSLSKDIAKIKVTERAKDMKYSKTRIHPKNLRSVEISSPIVSCSFTVYTKSP